MNNALRFSLPEGLLCVNPKAEAGVPFDAITCLIDRAGSVLTLIEDHFENESSRLANHVIAAVRCARHPRSEAREAMDRYPVPNADSEQFHH